MFQVYIYHSSNLSIDKGFATQSSCEDVSQSTITSSLGGTSQLTFSYMADSCYTCPSGGWHIPRGKLKVGNRLGNGEHGSE